MQTKLFSELGLSPEVLKAIDKLGFEKASPIQTESIPVLLQGRDVVGQSQTGSGKTAAFAIPAIEKVDPQLKAVQVLILCPTRELAVQVAEEIHKLALFKRGIHTLPIYGGQSYERQFYGLQQGAQIVIGTPGRVMDHMRRGTLRLDAVKMMILDEADVMLNMGFREDIEYVLGAVPKERQTVFFSATMPRPIRELIERFSREPQTVRIDQKAMTVPTVEQSYYEVDRRFKVELLTRLIDIHDLKLGIIFCNTKRMVDDLVDHLEAQGYSADRLHGDMTQAMRDRVMGKFRKSGLEFLVATDVAARGIDVDDVQVVFNYDLPYDPEDYVHRIGRTGRAGRSGRAISFAAGREVFQIRNIERFTNMRIHRAKIPTLDEVEAARDNVVIDRIRAILTGGEFHQQDHLIERLLEEGHSSTDIAAALLHQMLNGESAVAGRPAKPGDKPAPGIKPAAKQVIPAATTVPASGPATKPKPMIPAATQPLPRPTAVAKPAPAEVSAAVPAEPTDQGAAGAITASAQVAPGVSPESDAVIESGAVETGSPAAVGAAAGGTAESSATTEPVAPAEDPVEPVHTKPPVRPTKPGKEPKPFREREAKTFRPPEGQAPPWKSAKPWENRPPGPRVAGKGPARPPYGAATGSGYDQVRPNVRGPADHPGKPMRKPSTVPEWVQKKTRTGYTKRDAGAGAGREFETTRPPARDADAPFTKRPERPPFKPRTSEGAAVRPKPSRRTPADQTRIWINVGAEMGVAPGDVVGAILGETGLPSGTVGVVDIRERHSFVDVSTEHAAKVLSSLRHTRIKGNPLKVKTA